MFIKNLGSGFVFLVIYLSIISIYFGIVLLNLAISLFKKTSAVLQSVQLKLKGFLFWNNSLNLFFSQLPNIMLASIMNLH